MRLKSFLGRIQALLQNGSNSLATDLLTEFLLDTYGKPTGLNLPNLQELTEKKTAEIVSILKRRLTELSQNSECNNSSRSYEDESLTVDDLLLIESTALDIDLSSEDYTDREEVDSARQNRRIFTSTANISNEVSPTGKSPIKVGSEFPVPPVPFPQSTPETLLNASPHSQNRRNQDFLDEDDLPLYHDDHNFESERGAETNPDDGFDVELENAGFIDPDTYGDGYEDLDDSDELLDGLEDDSELGWRDDFGEVEHEGALSRNERAFQIALDVGLQFGWGKNGIDLLHEIFMERGWGQAQGAMRSLLAKEVTIEELRLAKDVKDLWESRDDFSMAFHRQRKDVSDYTYQGGRVLSWVQIFKLIKLFPDGTDMSEIELFLDREYDQWFRPQRKYRLYNSFLSHLKSMTESGSVIEPWMSDCVDFTGHEGWVDDEDSEKYRIGTPFYVELSQMGLIPDIWLDSLDYIMGPPDDALMKDCIGS